MSVASCLSSPASGPARVLKDRPMPDSDDATFNSFGSFGDEPSEPRTKNDDDDSVRTVSAADWNWEPPEADDDLSWLPAELAYGVRVRRWLEREDSRSDDNDPVWAHRWALNWLEHEKVTVEFLLPQAKRKAVELRGQLTEFVRNASRAIDDIERLGVTARLRRTRQILYRECFSLIGQLDDPFSFYQRTDLERAGETFLQLKREDSLPLIDDVRAVGLQIIETPDGNEFGGFELLRRHLGSLAERVDELEPAANRDEWSGTQDGKAEKLSTLEGSDSGAGGVDPEAVNATIVEPSQRFWDEVRSKESRALMRCLLDSPSGRVKRSDFEAAPNGFRQESPSEETIRRAIDRLKTRLTDTTNGWRIERSTDLDRPDAEVWIVRPGQN
jgi:hypothetical protein